MKVLIIGNGGREHALTWKVAQSPQVTQIFVAPGNAGTGLEPKAKNIPISATNIPSLVDFAREHQIDLTIVGPEAPLVGGLVNAFLKYNLPCFGPTRYAAQLEGSKAFTKDFLSRYHIPTAEYKTFTTIQYAKEYLETHHYPVVIKADGLASGKGVVIAHSYHEALKAAEEMLSGHAFGSAGMKIVIEDFLVGEEASFIALVDGKNILPLASSQDHKARDDGDKGPNTGGMGAYSPAPVVTSEIEQKIIDQVMRPAVDGMLSEGHPYYGFLYAGIMISPQGDIKVLEFNCRMGDPETEPLMMRLRSDLVTLCQAALQQQLNKVKIEWDPRPALGVICAAGGYPLDYRKGDVITNLPHETANCKVFHAGTENIQGNILTNGGRVLCVTALGDNIAEAQKTAYEAVKGIHWENIYYRRDIGYRAIQRAHKK